MPFTIALVRDCFPGSEAARHKLSSVSKAEMPQEDKGDNGKSPERKQEDRHRNKGCQRKASEPRDIHLNSLNLHHQQELVGWQDKQGSKNADVEEMNGDRGKRNLQYGTEAQQISSHLNQHH